MYELDPTNHSTIEIPLKIESLVSVDHNHLTQMLLQII
jgi:hypothetical protein